MLKKVLHLFNVVKHMNYFLEVYLARDYVTLFWIGVEMKLKKHLVSMTQ